MYGNENLIKTLELGMEGLQRACESKLNLRQGGDLQILENELMSLSELAARYATYIAHRHGCGCGDQGHDSAYKAFENTAKRVRKALGFSYP